MTGLGGVGWPPPAPLRTARLVLRPVGAEDRGLLLELATNARVRAHLGGPRDRSELERELAGSALDQAGRFVVERDGGAAGLVTLDRRDPARPGHLHPDGGEAELSYQLLPHAWGSGLAAEAAGAALDWFAGERPEEPVVLCTQAANARSVRLARRLGFTEVEQFEEFGAEQWFGVRTAASSGS